MHSPVDCPLTIEMLYTMNSSAAEKREPRYSTIAFYQKYATVITVVSDYGSPNFTDFFAEYFPVGYQRSSIRW